MVICHSDRTYNNPTYFGKNESLRSEPTYCFQADVTGFLLERILVERVNSADQINLVVTCTADGTSHHLTKNIYFLSEMRNLRNRKFFCFSFLSKNIPPRGYMSL